MVGEFLRCSVPYALVEWSAIRSAIALFAAIDPHSERAQDCKFVQTAPDGTIYSAAGESRAKVTRYVTLAVILLSLHNSSSRTQGSLLNRIYHSRLHLETSGVSEPHRKHR
jgi:hypothetical protein